MNNYGNQLKHHREIAGLNQPELAKAIGTSQANICRWEKGDVLPNIEFCIRIAKYYHITLNELFGLDEINEQQPLQAHPQNKAVAFATEYSDIIKDNNFVSISKLYKAITPELRGLMLGYLIGLLQNNGVNTESILKY